MFSHSQECEVPCLTRHQASMFKPFNQKCRQHEVCAQVMAPGSVWCHREHKGYQLWSPGLFLDWWVCTGFGYLFVALWNCQHLHLSKLWQSSELIMFFSRSERPERQQVDALWSWWPANLVTLTQATNFCITSPYSIPIPLLVILPLPSDRTFPCSNSEENGRGTFFPPSPEDQCWVCFMGFMICPFSSWQGCGDLGVSSGPWQSHRHFWAVTVILSIRTNTGHSSDGWGHSLNSSTPGSCTTLHNHHLQRSHLARCSQLAAEVKPLHTRGESTGKWNLVSDVLKGFQRIL